MANQIIGNLSLAVVVLILSLIPLHVFDQYFLVAGEETGKALIEMTCNQTEYPEECISALESDPGSLSANLTGLTKIVIQQSATKLSQTVAYVDALVKNETDYATWGFLLFCRDSYNSSFYQVQEGLQAFRQQKFDESYKSVAALNKAVVDCNNQGLKMLNQVNTILFRLTKDAMEILDLLF